MLEILRFLFNGTYTKKTLLTLNIYNLLNLPETPELSHAQKTNPSPANPEQKEDAYRLILITF